jgi:small subunit ribosomal protein S2
MDINNNASHADASEKKEKESTSISFDLQAPAADEALLTDMAKAGILYGHKKYRKNPQFNEYVYGVRNGIEVIDLAKTASAIEIVSQFLRKNKNEKKNIMVVGTQAAAQEAVRKLSAALNNCPYVVNKWIGGLITNFSVISRRLEYLKKMKRDLEEGRLEQYTKKERLLIEREVAKLEKRFEGMSDYMTPPDVVFIIDSSVKAHKTALHEAHVKGCTVLGIIDNDDDPADFNYFIPGNDHTRSSINWIVDKIISNL